MNPITLTIDHLLGKPSPKVLWLMQIGEQLGAERQMRVPSAPTAKREPVGERNRKIARILARDGEDCCYCGKPLGEDMTLEHRIAQSRGGTDELDNLKLAHARCNREVGNLPPDMKDALAARINNSTRDGGKANNLPPSNNGL